MNSLRLALFCGIWISIYAQERADVRYYLQAGAQSVSPRGDLDGHTVLRADTGQGHTPETVELSRLKTFALAQIRLGAQVNTLNQVSLGWAWGKSTAWQTLDFEYRRRFFVTPFLSLGFGIGYGFSRLAIPDAATWTDLSGTPQHGRALLSGNGPHVSAGLDWAWNTSWTLRLESEYAWWMFSNITTERNDFSRLSRELWCWNLSARAAIIYVF